MAASSTDVELELRVIARTVDAWNHRDIEDFLDCLTDDVYWDDPPMPSPAQNKSDVRRWCETVMRAIPDFTFKIRCIYRGPDHRFALHWEATGTLSGRFEPPGFAPTRRRFATHGVDLADFRDGRICRIVTNFDAVRAAEQMGLLPPKPRPGGALEWLAVRIQRIVASFQRTRGSNARDH